MLKKLEKRAARREKRRLKLKQDDEKQQVHKAKKLVGLKNKSGEALEMAKLQNQLGVMGCLACRATQCKWESNVDMEVCNSRLKDLGEEINRVRADKDEQVFISNVGKLHIVYCATHKYTIKISVKSFIYNHIILPFKFLMHSLVGPAGRKQ